MKSITLLSWLAATGALLTAKTTSAQTYTPSNRIPVADTTLGTQVSGSGNNFNIQGGLNKGQTLFHSFTDFSIPTNGAANFIKNPATRDIITRVTGGNYSDLNGTLNSNGANFLLINPNGVVFGPNVQLNVGKAFAASTANGVDLVDGNGGKYTFGTNANGDAPLLTIDPNVFLNISRLNMGANLPGSSGIVNYGTLQTANSGQYFGLIGGNVTMNGGKVIAPGGRIELGGLIDFGSISWGEENSFPKLTFPTDVTRSTVTLTGESSVAVAGNGGGSIAITAKDLNVLDGSQVSAGISQPSSNSKAGDIVINVVSNIEVGGNKPSSIKNEVAENSVGNAGNIDIKAKVLNISNGGEVQAATKGNGNGGNVSITADEINVFEALDSNTFASINTEVLISLIAGDRQGGNLAIDTRRLSVRNGAYISADTYGSGRGGDLNIKAADLDLNRASISTVNNRQGTGGNLTISGTNLKVDSGVISADILRTGQGGNLSITVANLELLGRASISADTFRKGTAGNLTIVADNLQHLDRSRISASTLNDSGQAGDLKITTKDTLQIKNRAYISADTRASGRGGNLHITAGNLQLIGGFISADTYKQGIAGNLTIFANNVQALDGSQISTAAEGSGNAGSLTVNANNLLQIKGGSSITSSTYGGSGNAGDLTVNANTVEIDGERLRPNSTNAATIGSGLYTQVNSGDSGNNAGTLRLNAKKLSVSNGGKVQAATFGKGNGGSIIITADEIDVFNSPGVTPKQRTNINVGVSIDPQNNLDSQGNLLFPEGNAGNLTIDTRSLSVRNGAAVRSDTQGKGNGGLLAINATESVAVVGAGSTLNVGVGSGAVGNGGELKLTTPQLVVKDGSTISTSSAGTGVAGKLDINAKTIDLQNRGAISAETQSGKGGNIELNVKDYLLLRGNSWISATAGTAQQGGDGGNIKIITPFIMALSGNNDITANAYTGNGGKVIISSDGLFGIEYRANGLGSDFTSDITASSTFGQSGTVNIDTPGADPGKDSTELPNAPNDASNQISQACSAETRQNKLTVTGRGGMPPDANDPLTPDVVWQDARATSPAPTASNATTKPDRLPPPAVGWQFDGKGKVTLIAAGTPGQTAGTKVTCSNTRGNSHSQ